jgi:hypothetical protein
MIRNTALNRSLLAALTLLLLAFIPANVRAARGPAIAKWGRFEHSFKSSLPSANPLQDVTLSVLFISPLGDATTVDAFWDGGRTWRVRFSPDQLGRWTFKTTCSVPANRGLHNQSGEFICTAPSGQDPFRQHGPVRVARDHRHFEHADGTPFFWLADTVWSGPRVAESEDWQLYALTRARQKFNVAQWAVAPGQDAKRQSAFTGLPGPIAINPEFFQRLDARLDTLSRAGILSAIAPILELESQHAAAWALPDDEAALLVRYVVARWGADPVAWLIPFETDTAASNIDRWKHIGQTVFGSRPHAPVIFYPGETHWLLDTFSDQPWVDAFGYQTVMDLTDDALRWTVTGPFTTQWKSEPARPLIPFAPSENALAPQAARRFTADDTRHAIYWSLLLAPPAGVSYGAQGVVNWDTTIGAKDPQTQMPDLPMWHKALFMPAAKQMSHLATLMNSIEFWRLRPRPKVIATQPGNLAPQRFIAAASTETSDLSILYVPEDRTVEVSLDALPRSPSVVWLNPRTGEKNPSVAVVSTSTCQFPTPNTGDWLLLMKAGK